MPESPLVSPLASENQAWSLFPERGVRDIGAHNMADSAVVRADMKKKGPNKEPLSDKRSIAGKDENG